MFAVNWFQLFVYRYDSPVNASPSRIADHLRPWEEDYEGHMSRRSYFSGISPFLPSTPGLVGATTSPKPGSAGGRKSSTLPSRISPGHQGMGLNYSTDFSTDMSDGEKESVKPVRVSSAYAATPPSMGNGHHGGGGGSLPNMPPSSLAATDDEDEDIEFMVLPQAPNVYPMHLLLTTNYRLPGDVDRINLERHLTDAEFEAVFKCLRDEFYRLPYWKRCELKRKNFLFWVATKKNCVHFDGRRNEWFIWKNREKNYLRTAAVSCLFTFCQLPHSAVARVDMHCLFRRRRGNNWVFGNQKRCIHLTIHLLLLAKKDSYFSVCKKIISNNNAAIVPIRDGFELRHF